MEDLGLSEQLYDNKQSVNILHIKYCIIIVSLVLLFAFCKRYKLDGQRYYRGKVVSMV